MSHCSLACLFALVKLFGWLVAHTKNQISSNTKNNIALCFAHKSAKEQQQLYKKSLNHTLCCLLEMASIWHHPIEQVLGQITTETLCSAYKNDPRGKIIIVPHFGSWELMMLWLARQGLVYGLYKAARSKRLDDYILSKRSRNGAILVPTNLIGLRALLKALKAGATVMILPDQKPHSDSAKITSNFYGHPASTSLLIKKLIKKINCCIYIASAMRNLNKPSYAIKLNQLDAEALSGKDQQSADYLNRSIERFIKVDEAQYQWSYQRFSKNIYNKKH